MNSINMSTNEPKAQNEPMRILWNEDTLIVLLECIIEVGAHIQENGDSKKKSAETKWNEVAGCFFDHNLGRQFKHLRSTDGTNNDGRKFKDKFKEYRKKVVHFIETGTNQFTGGNC